MFTRRLILLFALAGALVACVGPNIARQTPGADPSAPPEVRPGACHPDVHAWARRCSERGATVTATQCPTATLFVVQASGLRVELVRDPQRGFQRAGPWGVSPIGSFDDWGRVDARLRAAFDQVLSCARADGRLPATLTAPALTGVPVRRDMVRPPTFAERTPWLLVLALIAYAGTVRRPGRVRRVDLAVTAGLFALTWLARTFSVEGAFFHQNGQGPLWIAHLALLQYHPYGPGYLELFGHALHLGSLSPERAVFGAQNLLGSLVPAGAWVFARRVGAGRPIALELALGVAFDPLLGRLARSESYYGAIVSLAFLAAALLARPAVRAPWRSREFVLACVAAGLVLAQALRVHPVGWVACGVVPLVSLVGRGALSRRLRSTLAGFVLVGVTAALAAWPAMRVVLASDLGAQWVPRSVRVLASGAMRDAWPVFVLAPALVAATRVPKRFLVHALVGAGVAFVAGLANVVATTGSRPWVLSAYHWLYAPVLVATGAAMLRAIPRTRSQAMIVAAAVLGVAVVSASSRRVAMTRLPTDAIELRHAVAWRDRLPQGARVVSLERAGKHMLVLPIYPGVGANRVTAVPWTLPEAPPALDAVGSNAFYYRSSVCSTEAAVRACEAIERTYTLEPVSTWELPAIQSMAHLTYATAPIRTGLYRVRGRRERTQEP